MHHFLALFWFFYFHYLLGSLIGAFFFLAAFALFGVETGLHRKYVAFLLATFEVRLRLALSYRCPPFTNNTCTSTCTTTVAAAAAFAPFAA